MASAIELTRVSKKFGKRLVLDEIDLGVPEQSVFAFLGNNGAGKSTTIRLITALLRPSAGQVTVLGMDMSKHRVVVLGQVGCLVDSASLYPNLTAAQFLHIGCTIKGLPQSEIERVLAVVGLQDTRHARTASFSLGMKQRLALAHALLGQPRLLILDEPSNGLDPQGIQEIRELLAELPARTGCTVFVSSHQLDEVEKFATHVAVLHAGKVLCQEPIGDLMARNPGFLEIEISDGQHAVDLLKSHDYDVRLAGQRSIHVHRIAPGDADTVHARLIGGGARLFQSVYQKPTLEEWFLRLTGDRKEGHAA